MASLATLCSAPRAFKPIDSEGIISRWDDRTQSLILDRVYTSVSTLLKKEGSPLPSVVAVDATPTPPIQSASRVIVDDSHVKSQKEMHFCACKKVIDLARDGLPDGKVIYVTRAGSKFPLLDSALAEAYYWKYTEAGDFSFKFTVEDYSPLLGGVRKKAWNGGNRKVKGSRQSSKVTRKRGVDTLIMAGQLGMRRSPALKGLPKTIRDYYTFNQTLDADGSGEISTFFSLRNPNTPINGTGPPYQRFTNYSSLFDEFKVESLSITENNLTLSVNNGTCRAAVDYDSQASGTYLYEDLGQNDTVREFSGTNQLYYTAKDVPLTSGVGTTVIHQKGWYDFASPPDVGFIVIAGKGYTPGQKFSFTCTMIVKMRRRRTIAISREDREKHSEYLAEWEEEEMKRMVKKLSETKLKKPS